jgi:aspartate racemase
MKTVGMLAGSSWDLTALYCRTMNDLMRRHLGDGHSAKMLIHTSDAAELTALREKGQWQEVGDLLEEAGKCLVTAGADFFMICDHDLHIVAEQLDAATSMPFLHIGEAIGECLRQDGIRRVGMLSAAFTVEQTLLRQYLVDNFTIELLLPGAGASFAIHDLISQEESGLTLASQNKLEAIFNNFIRLGVEVVLFTDQRIGRRFFQSNCPLPIHDTVSLHAEAAVRRAIA